MRDRGTAAADRLVYIGGVGHSGSTLLDLLLNNHSQIQSTGEVHRLALYAREEREPCTCGQPVRQCPFWLEVERRVKQLRNLPPEARPLLTDELMLRSEDVGPVGDVLERAALVQPWAAVARAVTRRVAPAHHRAALASLDWYHAIRRATGAPVVIDTTKDPRRLKLLYSYSRDHYRLIYLVRDGRAVTASAIRRTGQPMDAVARRWRRLHLHSQLAQWSIPSSRKIQVRYEMLCEQPAVVLESLFSFIGVAPEEGVETIRKTAAHNIGGNAMRFRSRETEIRLDERWKKELTRPQLETFDRIAGAMNRRLGYG